MGSVEVFHFTHASAKAGWFLSDVWSWLRQRQPLPADSRHVRRQQHSQGEEPVGGEGHRGCAWPKWANPLCDSKGATRGKTPWMQKYMLRGTKFSHFVCNDNRAFVPHEQTWKWSGDHIYAIQNQSCRHTSIGFERASILCDSGDKTSFISCVNKTQFKSLVELHLLFLLRSR